MRIAVTGASGFVGGVVARRLAVHGHTVFTYGRRAPAELVEDLPNYSCWDLPDAPPNLPELDAVVHCAAKVGDWGDEAYYRQVNVAGTQTTLDAFVQVPRFIYVSSASVYSSSQDTTHLSEQAATGTGLYTAYAKTKFEAESLVRSGGRDAVILRPQIIYGPGDTTIMPRVLAARLGDCLAVPGNGQNHVSVTHVYNFADGIEQLLASSVLNGTFNIADNVTPQMSELLVTLLTRYGTPTRLFFIPKPVAWLAAQVSENACRIARRPNPPRLTRYLVSQIAEDRTLDLTSAQRSFSYAPQLSFRDGPLRDEGC